MSTAEQKYKPIKVQRTSDLIVKEIWDLIIQGQIKPGDKLPPERELVNKFKVSQVTLREALFKLETYGHITRKRGQGGGSIVLDIAPSQGISLLLNYLHTKKYTIDQLIEARRKIEPLIAEVAAQKITKKDIKKLEDHLKKHEDDYREKSSSSCGWKFYLLIVRITKNEILIVIEELLIRLLLEVEFSIGISDLESPEEQFEYNKNTYLGQKIVAKAIIAKDPNKARKEMILLRERWSVLIKDINKTYQKNH